MFTGQQKPQVSISPFSLFNNGAANVSTNLGGAEAAVRCPLWDRGLCTRMTAGLECQRT